MAKAKGLVKFTPSEDGRTCDGITVDGTPVMVQSAVIHIAHDALNYAELNVYVDVDGVEAVDGMFYTFFAGTRMRLVDLTEFDVVAKDGTTDHLFKDHAPGTVAARIVEYVGRIADCKVEPDEMQHAVLGILNGD